MTQHELIIAIEDCNKGQLNFNLGRNRAFLFSKRWYPLRATVNHAREFIFETELTTDRALLELVLVLPYTRISEIEFVNNFPVELNQNELFEEVKKIARILNSLT